MRKQRIQLYDNLGIQYNEGFRKLSGKITSPDMSDLKSRIKFKNNLFKRYFSKNKVIFSWQDMIMLGEWMQSEEFQCSKEEIPLTPYLNSAVYYSEGAVCHKTGREWSPIRENIDKTPSTSSAIVFDKIGEDEFSFKILLPTREKGIPHKHFIHFVTTNHKACIPDDMRVDDKGVSPSWFEEGDDRGTYDFVKHSNGTEIQIVDAEYMNVTPDEAKQIAVDEFQRWLMINYFMMNFQREIVTYEYDGKAALSHMPTKTPKQRAAKNAIRLGKIYKVIVTDEWLNRTKKQFRYYQSAGDRSGFWGLRRVKKDYWERYPERLEDVNNYRVPSQKTIQEKSRYLKPLNWDEMFIEFRQKPTRWERNPNLLHDGVGEEMKPNTYKLNRKAS